MNRNKLYKQSTSYSSNPFEQVRAVKVEYVREDQKPGPVTVITPDEWDKQIAQDAADGLFDEEFAEIDKCREGLK
jgi:hypothetical protein